MRTIVVTGAASGIGKATMNLLRDRADSVIGVDIHDADVVVDLSTAQGRVEMWSTKSRTAAAGWSTASSPSPDWRSRSP